MWIAAILAALIPLLAPVWDQISALINSWFASAGG